MLPFFRFAILITSIGCGITLAHVAQAELQAQHQVAIQKDESTRLYLPEGASLRFLTLGQRTTIADLYWLRFVQYVGTPSVLDAGIPLALGLADLITELDPAYGYAYQAAGVALSAASRVDESNRILEKGVKHVPDRWQLPFYLSFNYWYEQKELEKGAKMLERAAALPTAPAFVPRLVARLYSAAGKAGAARAYFESMLSETTEPTVRRSIEKRLADLHVETDIVLLRTLLERYRTSHGVYPPILDALVGPSLVAIPVAPNGKPYRYDSASGEILPPDGLRLGREIPTAQSNREE